MSPHKQLLHPPQLAHLPVLNASSTTLIGSRMLFAPEPSIGPDSRTSTRWRQSGQMAESRTAVWPSIFETALEQVSGIVQLNQVRQVTYMRTEPEAFGSNPCDSLSKR